MIQLYVGQMIRKRRTEIGLSQEQVALQAGVTTTYLGQVERGDRNPTVGFLEKVAESLEVDITYFFENTKSADGSPAENLIRSYLRNLNEEQKQKIAQIVAVISDTIK